MTQGILVRLSSLTMSGIFMMAIGICVIAQTGTSTVTGTVTDPQGKVLPGATVVLANPAKSFTRTQTTNESGAFSFNAIPPDTYTLEVSATGFNKAIVNEVQALVA